MDLKVYINPVRLFAAKIASTFMMGRMSRLPIMVTVLWVMAPDYRTPTSVQMGSVHHE